MHIYLIRYTYTSGRWTPLHQSTIDLCNATTPNQDNLCRNTDTLHISMYPRQMDPLSIDYRSLQCYYALNQNNAYVEIWIHIYLRQMDPPQLSIDLCIATTPNQNNICIEKYGISY